MLQQWVIALLQNSIHLDRLIIHAGQIGIFTKLLSSLGLYGNWSSQNPFSSSS